MEIKGKKFAFLGDSITEGAGASKPENNFWRQFGSRNGVEVSGYGIGGTRIAPQRGQETPDGNFVSRVKDIREDADVIVVFGGTNDFGHGNAAFGHVGDTDPTTFCGAMYTLLKSLIERFPLSEIVVMTPTHRGSEDVEINEIGLPCHRLSAYVAAEKAIAAAFSVPVLDLWAVSGIQPRIPVVKELCMPDALHPNDRGHLRICERLEGFLKTL